MKLKLDHIGVTNQYTISRVDEKGNGIIIITGHLGGCDFMSAEEVEPRLQVLSGMVAAWNTLGLMTDALNANNVALEKILNDVQK